MHTSSSVHSWDIINWDIMNWIFQKYLCIVNCAYKTHFENPFTYAHYIPCCGGLCIMIIIMIIIISQLLYWCIYKKSQLIGYKIILLIQKWSEGLPTSPLLTKLLSTYAKNHSRLKINPRGGKEQVMILAIIEQINVAWHLCLHTCIHVLDSDAMHQRSQHFNASNQRLKLWVHNL